MFIGLALVLVKLIVVNNGFPDSHCTIKEWKCLDKQSLFYGCLKLERKCNQQISRRKYQYQTKMSSLTPCYFYTI